MTARLGALYYPGSGRSYGRVMGLGRPVRRRRLGQYSDVGVTAAEMSTTPPDSTQGTDPITGVPYVGTAALMPAAAASMVESAGQSAASMVESAGQSIEQAVISPITSAVSSVTSGVQTFFSSLSTLAEFLVVGLVAYAVIRVSKEL